MELGIKCPIKKVFFMELGVKCPTKKVFFLNGVKCQMPH